MTGLRRAALLVAALGLAACQHAPPSPVGAPRPPAPSAARESPAEGARVLHIDAAGSRLEMRVRAAGPLAPLGHAHVLLAGGLRGEVVLAADPARSRLRLRIPVEQIVVDDAQARAAAGADFARPVPEEARRGTREHLLGERQFDAAHFPEIVLDGAGPLPAAADDSAGEATLRVAVTVRGRTVPMDVPVAWSLAGGELRARGQLALSQSALGIEPYSVGGGALRVADAVEVAFDLRAR